MSVGIVDVREWQNTLDLKTGKKTDSDADAVQMLKNVLKRHPFPGDTAPESNPWVTDTALDLVDAYDPQFVFLTYAQQYFSARFLPTTEGERQAMYDKVFAEIDRFVERTGFTPVIVGAGDMIPVAGHIDLSKLDGLGVCSHWATHYAGLYDATSRDLEYIKGLEAVERVLTKEEFMEKFQGVPGDADRLPDYFVAAREGFCFKTPALRRPCMIPACNGSIPLSLPWGEAAAVTDIGGWVLAGLERQKIALILIEGIGMKDFRRPFTPCRNGLDWYFYEPGEAQYMAISQGKQQMFEHNPGYRDYREENDDYPFSGYFNSIPEHTLGKRFAGRSAAVGNRSMFIHTLTGADVSIECFARNLNNQGALGVVHRFDK